MHERVHAQLFFWESKPNPQAFSVFLKKLADKK